MKYSIDWLIERFEKGEALKYLFFWGHTSKTNEEIGKHCFSQWYVAPFEYEGIKYTTAEHWMMAEKARMFNDIEVLEKILKCTSPAEAKKLGREVRGFDNTLWENERYDIVKKGNMLKFSQHPLLEEFLLNTGSRIIVEASPVDQIWGIGLSQDSDHIDNPYRWNGLNLLGFDLMEVREFLRRELY